MRLDVHRLPGGRGSYTVGVQRRGGGAIPTSHCCRMCGRFLCPTSDWRFTKMFGRQRAARVSQP